jgi:hypothetical protein
MLNFRLPILFNLDFFYLIINSLFLTFKVCRKLRNDFLIEFELLPEVLHCTNAVRGYFRCVIVLDRCIPFFTKDTDFYLKNVV